MLVLIIKIISYTRFFYFIFKHIYYRQTSFTIFATITLDVISLVKSNCIYRNIIISMIIKKELHKGIRFEYVYLILLLYHISIYIIKFYDFLPLIIIKTKFNKKVRVNGGNNYDYV